MQRTADPLHGALHEINSFLSYASIGHIVSLMITRTLRRCPEEKVLGHSIADITFSLLRRLSHKASLLSTLIFHITISQEYLLEIRKISSYTLAFSLES